MTLSARQLLDAAVEQLQRAHDEARADLLRQGFAESDLYRVKSTTGHYILLDSLTALVDAQRTLVAAKES